jgi:hypothetical protein
MIPQAMQLVIGGAPQRAGDVGGALYGFGADAGMFRHQAARTMGARGVETISAIAVFHV